jgi:hypothetical protein
MDSRLRVATITVSLLLPVLFVLYVAGYFVLGNAAPEEWPLRVFRSEWQYRPYRPVVPIESWLTGEEVEAAWMLPNTIRRPATKSKLG